MHSDFEPRPSNVGSVVFAVVVIGAILYFTFAALQGEHGLLRLIRIEAQESQMREELQELRGARALVANRTRRLSDRDLDLDLLDEQARRVLGLGRVDEIIIR